MNKWLSLRNPPRLYESRRQYFERIVGIHAGFCVDDMHFTVDHKTKTGKVFVIPKGERTLNSIQSDLEAQTSMADKIEWIIDSVDSLVYPIRKK